MKDAVDLGRVTVWELEQRTADAQRRNDADELKRLAKEWRRRETRAKHLKASRKLSSV